MKTYLDEQFKRNWKIVPSERNPKCWDVKASDDGYIEATLLDKSEAKFRAWLLNACDSFNYRLFTTQQGVSTFQMRVDFAIKLFLTQNRLIFGERAFDNVFEMGDYDDVARAILKRSEKRPALREALNKMGYLKHWADLVTQPALY